MGNINPLFDKLKGEGTKYRWYRYISDDTYITKDKSCLKINWELGQAMRNEDYETTYLRFKELIFRVLKVENKPLAYKLGIDYSNVVEFSEFAAEELTLLVMRDSYYRNNVRSWVNMLPSILTRMTILQYRRFLENFEFTHGNKFNQEVADAISEMNKNRLVIEERYREDIENLLIIKNSPKYIDYVLENFCRYREDTKIYRNIRTSLLLSALNNKVVLFRLGEDMRDYVKILYNKYISVFTEDLFNQNHKVLERNELIDTKRR